MNQYGQSAFQGGRPQSPSDTQTGPCVAAPADRTNITGLRGITRQLRYKLAIRFALEGDLRFISHRDTMRLLERALSRSGLPVRFSEGFNPRPTLSLPLPRAVGVSTSADVLVLELTEAVEPREVLPRLAEQMPQGLSLQDAWALPAGETLHPEQASYEVALQDEELEPVRGAVSNLLAAGEWPIERTGRGKPSRTIDLRAMLVEASVEPGWLRWTCRITPAGSAKPGEWLTAFGLRASERLHRVRRTAVQWASPLRASAPAAIASGLT